MLSFEFWDIFKDPFFYRTPPVTASVLNPTEIFSIFHRNSYFVWNSNERDFVNNFQYFEHVVTKDA